jgi:hypothetical protein
LTNFKNCLPNQLADLQVARNSPDPSPLPNAATVAAMQEAHNGGLPSFRNVSDLMADLNADD